MILGASVYVTFHIFIELFRRAFVKCCWWSETPGEPKPIACSGERVQARREPSATQQTHAT